MFTAEERRLVRAAGRLYTDALEIFGNAGTREADIAELRFHIHAIQRMIMAQAAGRLHPGEFRLLGETIPEEGK